MQNHEENVAKSVDDGGNGLEFVLFYLRLLVFFFGLVLLRVDASQKAHYVKRARSHAASISMSKISK